MLFGLNYTFDNGLAYTEDHVVVYNLFAFKIPETISEVEVLNYFKKFGEVLKVRLMKYPKNKERCATINFADSKVAAEILRYNVHHLGYCRIGLAAAYSWCQPGAETAESTATDQPSCSNSNSVTKIPFILNLNDDCLELILKHLVIRDQLNFARTCQRFNDVFVMLSKVEYKILLLDKLESLTLWQIRQFLQIVGPQIKTLVGRVPAKHHKCIVDFLIDYCTNVKSLESLIFLDRVRKYEYFNYVATSDHCQ